MRRSAQAISSDDLLKLDPELKPHLDALGLRTADEYLEWCAQRHFARRLNKHWRERCRERFYAAEEAIQRRLAQAKAQKRNPRGILLELFSGETDEFQVQSPELALVQELLDSIENEDTKRAFQELLLHVQRDTGLISSRPALSRLGAQAGNTFSDGLLCLGRCREHWIRELRNWRPTSHNPLRQFTSLAAFLLAKYPLPPFLDSVWFRGHGDQAQWQQACYRALARGGSPRRLDFPIALTKQMSRHFLQAPKDFLLEQALRWGQVLGLGGSPRLVRAILGSRLAASFEHNDFWTTVIRWLIENPMLDPAQIGPLIDFIYQQNFEPQLVETAPGVMGVRPIEPNFSMKGRTAASLIQRMREWHASLRKQPEKADLEWLPAGIGGFELVEGTLVSGSLRRWTIVELLSRQALFHEGQVMRHCVASYDRSCAGGGSSIWSMGLERNHGKRKRMLTIELAVGSKRICQIRGKANRLASQKELEIVGRWASQQGLSIDAHWMR
jgi:hypothetical protein